MKRKVLPLLLCLMLVLTAVVFWPAAPANAADSNYMTLTADTEITLSGETLVVDLAGYNLTVKGTGTVRGFDTANDTYDHLACGVLTAEEGITCDSRFDAPNGACYVALTEGSYTTFHR